jgi:DegV family protein with EDD domain
MEPALKEGKDLLVLGFSSGLSTTYQSAVIAAEDLKEKYPDRKINVIDSLCAALGQGLLLTHACKKRDEGLSLDELTAWIEANKLRVCHWVTVNDLMHLKRGGRISATTAIVGSMLQFKPIIHVNDEGKLINVGKVRGRKASMEHLAEQLAAHIVPEDNDTIFITHGDCLDEAKELEKILKKKCGIKKVFIGHIGAVIGSHTGPGVLAVFFFGDHR